MDKSPFLLVFFFFFVHVHVLKGLYCTPTNIKLNLRTGETVRGQYTVLTDSLGSLRVKEERGVTFSGKVFVLSHAQVFRGTHPD